MQPLHIRIDLVSPLAAFDKRPSYLDGLLSGVYGERLLADQGASVARPGLDPFQEALNLSAFLEDTEIGGEMIWKASRLVPAWIGPLQWWTMTRRTDPLNYMWGQDTGLVKSNRASVDLNSGQERNYFWYLPIREASHLDAWCIGDPDAIRDLLGSARSIGKHRNNGFGLVSRVHVQHDEVAHQKWRWRPLPVEETGSEEDPALTYAPAFETVRPPYWDALARKKCRIPLLA
jgi:CRISPR type IV-associated protein Csf3